MSHSASLSCYDDLYISMIYCIISRIWLEQAHEYICVMYRSVFQLHYGGQSHITRVAIFR